MKGKRGELSVAWDDLREHFEGRDLDGVADVELYEAASDNVIIERGPGNPNMVLVEFLGRNDEMNEVIYLVKDTE